jgi:predicted transcriptional regulator
MQATKVEKQNILTLLQRLPEQTTVEEAMERLLILAKVEKGCQEADAGKVISHTEAEKRLEKWLK